MQSAHLSIAPPRAAFFRLLALLLLLLQPLIGVVGGANSAIRRRFYGSQARLPAARLPLDGGAMINSLRDRRNAIGCKDWWTLSDRRQQTSRLARIRENS